jgi:hypothetical protein
MASGRGGGDEAEAFLAKARRSTRRFQHLDAAIAAGYRPIGPDMPNMGQHWINPILAMRRTIDPATPAVLTYLPVGDELLLTGIAYTTPLQEGEALPAAPVPGAAWHFHANTVEEESIGHNHAAASNEGPGARLAMMHAWIWVPNPDGVFTPDNWALSSVRLGLQPPNQGSPAAAKALFLLAGGVDFYTDRAVAMGALDDDEMTEFRAALSALRRQLEELQHAASFEDPQTLEHLADRWEDLQQTLKSRLSTDGWTGIQAMFE